MCLCRSENYLQKSVLPSHQSPRIGLWSSLAVNAFTWRAVSLASNSNLILFFSFGFYFFQNKVSLCSLVCPVDQTVLELRYLPASISRVLRLWCVPPYPIKNDPRIWGHVHLCDSKLSSQFFHLDIDPFGIIFIAGRKQWAGFVFLCEDNHLSDHRLLEGPLFSHFCFLNTHCHQKQINHKMTGSFRNYKSSSSTCRPVSVFISFYSFCISTTQFWFL